MTSTTTDRYATVTPTSRLVLSAAATYAAAAGASWASVYVAGDVKQDQVDIFPALLGFAALATALVFALVVRPALANGATGRRPLVLGILAVVGIVAFWAGLPIILGGAALAVAPTAPAIRSRAIGTGAAVLAIAGNIVLSLVG